MPQRERIDLGDVAAWPNLEAALWQAARGKRARPDVAAFLADAQPGLNRLRAALLDGRLPDGSLRRFAIRDPKPRIIHAAPFIDRIAHHALVRLMESRLERALLPTSFACRPGRGVHAALQHAQALIRQRPTAWTLKLDVEHFFPNIEHARLLALLQRRFKGSAMRLVEAVVHGHASAPGRRLPIGSLTSQHFANQYLGELDRAALARPECLAHLRYMDDVVLWCPSLDTARALHEYLAGFASHILALKLKPPAIQRCDRGLALCGMRLGPRGIRLGLRRQRSWRQHWRAARERWLSGIDDDNAHQRACDMLRALAMPAEAARWQRGVIARWPLEVHGWMPEPAP